MNTATEPANVEADVPACDGSKVCRNWQCTMCKDITCTACGDDRASIMGTTLCRDCDIDECLRSGEAEWGKHGGIMAAIGWSIPQPHSPGCPCVWCVHGPFLVGQLSEAA